MPFVLGISGGSGCGKTALAGALAAALGDAAVLIHQDDYYHDLSHWPPEAVAAHNFDHPDSVDLALLALNLAELRAGRAVRAPRYDFVTHTRSAAAVPVAPRPVIVAEGLLLFFDPRLRRQIDLKVYLDMPADLRLARRLERDLRERAIPLGAALEQYVGSVRPMHLQFVEPLKGHADLVLAEPGLAAARDQILARLDSLRPAPRRSPNPFTV